MVTIRGKLTIWYLTILTVVLLGYGAAVYIYLSTSLLRMIDTSLRQQVIAFERHLTALERGEEPSEMATGRLGLAPQFVELIGSDGKTTDVASPSEAFHLPVNAQTLEQARTSAEPVLEDAFTDDGKPLRVATWRLLDEQGQVVSFIRAGYTIEEIERVRWQVVLLLGVSLLIVLALAGWGGRVLVDKVLRPVDRLTHTAQVISAKNFQQRVEVPATGDELARLAETFNQMIARLQEAFQREHRFTEDASHEMRTPLAVLRNEIEVALQRERSPQEYRASLQRCLDQVLRLSRLTEDLLMLARAETSEAVLERQPVELNALCEETVQYVQPLADERQLTLSFKPADAPIYVLGDARRLKQVLLNLLDNAIKYTPPSGHIGVELERTTAAAVVSVSDTGCGIAPDELPHIFERFYRRRQKGANENDGFGLGLAICRWIVEAHGGTIRVSSQPAQGTRFTFELPLFVG